MAAATPVTTHSIDPAERAAERRRACGPRDDHVRARRGCFERAADGRALDVRAVRGTGVTRHRVDVQRNRSPRSSGPRAAARARLLRCLNRMNDLIPGVRVRRRILYLDGQDLYAPTIDLGRGAAAHRHGVPEAEPLPQVDLRQRRLRAARARHERAETRRDRRARAAPGGAVGRGQGPPRRRARSASPAASSSACASPARSRSSPT